MASDLSRTRVQISPRYISLAYQGKVYDAFGGEGTLWRRFAKRLDAGVTYQQMTSPELNNTTLLSGITLGLRFHITGGRIPGEEKWNRQGETLLAIESHAQGGLSISASLEQLSIAQDTEVLPFSGMGFVAEYAFAIFSRQLLSIGIGQSTVYYGRSSLPLQKQLISWSYYL